MPNVAVIYYSATGNVYKLAEAIAAGARDTGAQVRLLKAAETAPYDAIVRNQRWADHATATAAIPEATLADIEWADALIFGSPSRFGSVASQMKVLIDQTGGLWAQGKLAGKVASGFTSASTAHGGLETTITTLFNTFACWGCIIVPPGYADPIQMQQGNPFGASFVAKRGATPGELELTSARFQGRRVAEIAGKLHG
ncbi:MAG: NAD(P)H:quinone oxidoreductase [Dehalococcoidia bacterium]|nr:NAD(P)H:quinone oxidoreductase [Dehalococcoidia bacterium]